MRLPAPTRSESKREENDDDDDEVVGESRSWNSTKGGNEACRSGEVVGIGGSEEDVNGGVAAEHSVTEKRRVG